MKKKILSVVMMVFMTMVMQAQRSGHIETTRSRHFVNDRNGRKLHTGGRSMGAPVGFSSKFYILMMGTVGITPTT